MINNETARITYYTVADQTTVYAITFMYDKDPATGEPELEVTLDGVVLTWGTDYVVNASGLQLTSTPELGHVLKIVRNMPLTQEQDYQTGLIRSEDIEHGFDRSVMRDQQIQEHISHIAEIPEDHEARIRQLEDEVDNLQDLVPNQATDENQLADKDFVNSSIATSTATFRGTYNSLVELEAITADKNDYGFVVSTDAAGNTVYSRYKYSGDSWVFEYNLNNSSFTAAQWAAINSGITAEQLAALGNTTGRCVGDIFLTKRTDTELCGAVECDGLQYNTTDFTGAQSIGQLLQANKIQYVSLSDYADEITAKGWCDKFGWDGVGTTAFKVPTLNAYIWQKLNTPVVGTGKGLGLIGAYTGTWAGRFNGQGNNATDYVILNTFNVDPGTGGGGDWIGGGAIGVVTDPTKSALTTDTTGIVSDQRVMVQLAVSATDEALETCTGVLADVAQLKGYDYVVEQQFPTAQNNYTWYRKYKSGWVEQGGKTTAGGTTTAVTLAVEMSDTEYLPQVTQINSSTAVWNDNIRVVYGSQTTLGFDVYTGSTNTDNGFVWEVKGMATNN